jgi:2-polyprenyl-3-methyl-5-hydroxy-6-metoxy-1,4-benzoquinol methylase/rubredoxin
MQKKVNNKIIDSIKCRLCGYSDTKFIDTEILDNKNYSIYKCKKCGLVFVNEIYDTISPDYINLSTIDESHLWLQGQHKSLAFQQFQKLINRFIGKTTNSTKLLDVGCGTGGFLNFVNENMQCSIFGFDSSKLQADYASKKFPLVKCAISINEYKHKIESPDTNFDIITLWDVLEHIRQPVQFLQDLTYNCKNGFIFLSVPNALPMVIKSKMNVFKIFTWAPNEHVSYFSVESLKYLCEKLNLQIISYGSVKIYKRELSIFELIRRFYFGLTFNFPKFSPQIYLLAKCPGTTSHK